MKLEESVAIFIVCPFYSIFFKRPLWGFLAKVKAFFFAEVAVQLENLERRARNGMRWSSCYSLFVAKPGLPGSDPDWQLSTLQNTAVSTTAADLNRVHAAVNLR